MTLALKFCAVKSEQGIIFFLCTNVKDTPDFLQIISIRPNLMLMYQGPSHLKDRGVCLR